MTTWISTQFLQLPATMFFLLRCIEYPLNIHILDVPRIWVDFVCRSGGSSPLWQTSFKDSPLTFWLSSSPELCPLAPQARRTMASCHFNLCTDLGVLDEKPQTHTYHRYSSSFQGTFCSSFCRFFIALLCCFIFCEGFIVVIWKGCSEQITTLLWETRSSH